MPAPKSEQPGSTPRNDDISSGPSQVLCRFPGTTRRLIAGPRSPAVRPRWCPDFDPLAGPVPSPDPTGTALPPLVTGISEGQRWVKTHMRGRAHGLPTLCPHLAPYPLISPHQEARNHAGIHTRVGTGEVSSPTGGVILDEAATRAYLKGRSGAHHLQIQPWLTRQPAPTPPHPAGQRLHPP